MSNDDERDYAEEHYNAHLLDAVLALSAPAEPEQDTWRQRAVEAEAALTAIGGVMATAPAFDKSTRDITIENILREAGQQADRLMTRPDGTPPYADLLDLTRDLAASRGRAAMADLAVRAQSMLDAAGEPDPS